jgi:ADP-heptose:LPS heptosyltransferase
MRFSKYRYRPIHAISERLLEVAAPLLRSTRREIPADLPLRILVLKFGGMGEAVLARSLVERLQERHPAMSVDFLVERRTIEVMTHGRKGKVFLYTPGEDGIAKALQLLREIRNRRYDAIIDFEQHSLLTAGFARATSIPIRVGFEPPLSGPRGGMFTHPIALREDQSMWNAFVRVGQVLDQSLPLELMTMPLPISPATNDWLDTWRKSKGIPRTGGHVVAMHLGVGPSAQYRRWPTERFVDLAHELTKAAKDVTILLTGAQSEHSLIDDFKGLFSGRSIDASDTGGLENTAVLLQNCDLLISGDTGIMHLSAAMGTPTVGLFGPNTPLCWAPVGPMATSVYPTQEPCSPCINSYRRHIPDACVAATTSACMSDIQVEDVLDAARSVIQGDWLGREKPDLVTIEMDSVHQGLIM